MLQSLKRLGAVVVLLLFALCSSRADTLVWDANGTNVASLGGTNGWSVANLWSNATTTAYQTWANGNVATFTGRICVASNITTAVSVSQITYSTNVTIGNSASTNTGTITFSGTYNDSNPAIVAMPPMFTTAAYPFDIYTKITGQIGGDGLVIKDSSDITSPGAAGVGRILFRPNNNSGHDFKGNVIVLGGNLHALSALGDPTNKIILKGGALWGNSGASVTYSIQRDIVVASDSGIGMNSSGAGTYEIIDLATGGHAITGTATLTCYNAVSGTTNELKLSGDMSGFTGTFVNNGTNNAANLLTIQTTATSAGGWILNGGTMKFNTANDTHIANGVGQQNLTINGGLLNMNGKSETINGLAGSGGIVENDLASTASTLSLGDGDASATFSGTIQNNGGTGGTLSVVKIGNGTQILSGTNQCSGYTITAGTLQVGNGPYSIDYPFTSPITNNATLAFNIANRTNIPPVAGSGLIIIGNGGMYGSGGTLTLTASNTFAGPLTVNNGTLVCAAPQSFNAPVSVANATLNSTVPQTFGNNLMIGNNAELDLKRPAASNFSSAANLAFNSSTLRFDLGAYGITPVAPLQAAGALTNSGTLTIFLNNVDPGSIGVASYPLIKYGSFVDGGSSSFALGAPINSQITAYITNNAANKSIDLVVTAIDYLQWTGATDFNWDTTTLNWLQHSSSTATTYADNELIRFDDSGKNTTITLAQGFSPIAIIVTNAAKNYSFNGNSGAINSGTLTKQGSGTLTLANPAYNYTGATLVSGGTLVIGNGAADTTLTSPIQDDAALVLNVVNSNTPPSIGGSGSVTVNNGGTLTLTNNNTYTGLTTVNGGIVQMSTSTAFGTADNGTSLSAGSELDVTASVTTAEPLTLGGGSGVTGGGAMVVQAGASTWSGSVTATANTVFNIANGATMNFVNGINGGNNTMTFVATTVANGGAITISSNLTAGTVILNNTTNMGGLILSGANNSITNVLVNGPVNSARPGSCGLWVKNSLALGTNTVVTLINTNETGNTGARLVMNNSVTIPAQVDLEVYTPGTGALGDGNYRSSLSSSGGNNTWNGPINIHGSATSGQYGSLSIWSESGNGVFNGPITLADGDAQLLLRGAATGVISNTINMGDNNIQTSDGGTWTIYSQGNVWSETRIAGTSTLQLGADNALCTNAPVNFITTGTTWNMNGFDQQIPGLSGIFGTIINRSSNSPSTLIISNNSNYVYGGGFAIYVGAKTLGLEIVAGTQTLQSTANSYAGPTLIHNGATLALTNNAGLGVSTPIQVDAGGTFDVSGKTNGTAGFYNLSSLQLLTGSGTIVGTFTNKGTIAPGGSIGNLTINGNFYNASNLLFEVNKGVSPSNDAITVSGTITNVGLGHGILTITNLNNSAPLVAGDKFFLFNQPVVFGNLMTVTGALSAPLAWSNSLAVDGSVSVYSTVVTSTNAYLTSLAIAPAGALVPAFTTNNFSYTATNAYVNNPVTVTAVAADAGATLQLSFNGGTSSTLTNGVASLPQTLILPTNTVAVTVTAADKSTIKTYLVNVTLQPSQTPAKLTNSVNGNTLTLSWPADHLGWHLQMQTNTISAGLTTNGWVVVPGSDQITSTNISITKTNPTVFYRLTYP
jgi:autotransporter-associated beta strand protein